jgi:hypothetical protein
MTGRTLCTIGYEKALLEDVISTLAGSRVATLIDVRDRPISRRPGFSKRQLAAAIEEAGMRYVHLQALGTPPEGRLANRRREWDLFWGIVEEKLARPEADLALQKAGEKSPKPRRAACCAMKPIGKSATAAGSPKSWRDATASRCPTSRLVAK